MAKSHDRSGGDPSQVAAHGRRMVTIIDPHIKRDSNYPIHKEATSKGYYIKDNDGKVGAQCTSQGTINTNTDINTVLKNTLC